MYTVKDRVWERGEREEREKKTLGKNEGADKEGRRGRKILLGVDASG